MERTRFEEELRALGADLGELAARASSQLGESVQALVERQADLARTVIARDPALSGVQRQLDDRAMKLLALQQPAARDLRLIVAAVRAGTDLERVGDHAVNIAQTTLVVMGRPVLPTEAALAQMGRLASAMLRDAVAAFARRDGALARDVLARDNEVDTARRNVFRQLLGQIRSAPGLTELCVSLMLVSRNLERVADHATNIAEDAIFLVSARDVRHMAELKAVADDAPTP